MKTLKLLIFAGLLLVSIDSFSKHKTHSAQKEVTIIHINYPESKDSDRLVLFYSISNIVTKNYYGDGYKSIIAERQKDGRYDFDISLTSNNRRPYIMIAKLNDGSSKTEAIANQATSYVILESYQLCKNDKITIDLKKNKAFEEGASFLHNFNFHFSGIGSFKYYLRYKADSLNYHTNLESDLLNADLTYNDANFEIRKIKRSLSLLNDYKEDLINDDYLELKTHCIFSVKTEEGLILHYEIKKHWDQLNQTGRDKILASYCESKSKLFDVPLQTALNSFDFPRAEISKMKIISYLKYGVNYRDSLTSVMISSEKGKALEKVLLLTLIEEGATMPDWSARIITAGKTIHSAEYLAEYKKLLRKVSGQFAYNFELPDTSGRMVKLSDYKGKIVFVDFWFTGCVNCLNFYKDELSKVEEKYKNDPDVVFITISIDKFRPLWVKSVMTGKYTSPTAQNLFTGGRGASDKVIKYYDVYSYPQPMIIGKDQRIYQYSHALRSQENLISAINSLKASR